MYCRNCGKEVAERAEICPSCGVGPLSEAKYCNSCGAETRPEAVVCTRCGIRLAVGGQKDWLVTLLLSIP